MEVTLMDWKVGDEFVVIDATQDGLSGFNGKIFKITKLKPDTTDNGNAFSPEKFIWFKGDKVDGCYFISKKNIRKATKLDKALT